MGADCDGFMKDIKVRVVSSPPEGNSAWSNSFDLKLPDFKAYCIAHPP
jgi:hypothetical protein